MQGKLRFGEKQTVGRRFHPNPAAPLSGNGEHENEEEEDEEEEDEEDENEEEEEEQEGGWSD